MALCFHGNHKGFHHGDLGSQLSERVAYLGQVLDTSHRTDLPSQAGEKTGLHHEANLALVILEDVRGSGVELLLAHSDIVRDKNALPGYGNLVEEEDGVVLVEPARKRIVEDRARGPFVGLPAKDLEPWRVQRQRERESVGSVLRGKRLYAGHQNFIGHDGAGGQHLRAVDDEAARILIANTGGVKTIRL